MFFHVYYIVYEYIRSDLITLFVFIKLRGTHEESNEERT